MICVSIVSHGQQEVATRLLLNLARIASPEVREIVYTRNVPEPALPSIDLGHMRLITIDNAEPRGFSQNHNTAFGRSNQPFFCVSNPDISLTEDPFPLLVQCLNECGLGLVAPLVCAPDGRTENTARLLYTPLELARQKLSPANHTNGAHWLAGMFMLFRSDAFESIGGFDESYFLYIEDVDICTRLRVRGWNLAQCPGAVVIHDARKHSHRSLKYTRWHLSGMLRYWSSPGFWHYRRLLSEPKDAAADDRRAP